MKFVIIFVFLFGFIFCLPLKEEKVNYSFNIETSDGTSRQEQGILENNILRIDGSYQYIGDDGQVYEVHYIADEKGFQPQGKHILNK